MRSMVDPIWRKELLERIGRLRPDSERRFGTMTAAQMIAHLTDQMRHTLGDVPTTPVPGIRQNPIVRHLAIYVIPWPKGRIKGPPGAFVTKPKEWDSDVAALCDLVARFAARDPFAPPSKHTFFGAMTDEDWGVFCYKHFNHHFGQFGV